MTQKIVVHTSTGIDTPHAEKLPTIIIEAGEPGLKRFVEFFTVNIRNTNTRRVYHRNACQFLDWCSERGIDELGLIQPVHVAAYIEELQDTLSAPSIKQQLASIRMLFDWLVTGQVVPINPATSVRGPKHSAKRGKTPVLSAEEAGKLLESIDINHLIGLRDRALIATMVYTFGRVGAVIKMRVEDYYPVGKRSWLRLHEKGGKRHEMPAHHNLETYIGLNPTKVQNPPLYPACSAL